MMRKGLLATAALAVALSIGFAASAADDMQEKRSAYMKQLGANMGALGKIAKGEAEYTPAAVGNAEAIVKLSKELLEYFPQGSGGGDSRAKPEIWEKWAEFEKAAMTFLAAAPGLVPAAQSGDAKQIGAALGAVGKTCGGCHEPFRAPKT